ncbi:hypothetical protein ACWEVD_16645 [Nocardia thailandica]
MCTIETAQADVSAAVRAALAGDAPDLSPQQIRNRLRMMRGSDQGHTDLDFAVQTLTQAVGRATEEHDVARLITEAHQQLHDEVTTTALCWGYDVDAAARLASGLVALVLLTLGYTGNAPSGAGGDRVPADNRIDPDRAAARFPRNIQEIQ